MGKSALLPSLFAQLLFFKECPWANPSGRSGLSEQKGDREWFAPVTLYKRVTVSNSLRSLMTKEQWEWFPLFHEVTGVSSRQTHGLTSQAVDALLENQSEYPRYNIKCLGKRDTKWTFPRCITFSPLHFMLYRGKSITCGTVWGWRLKRKWRGYDQKPAIQLFFYNFLEDVGGQVNQR